MIPTAMHSGNHHFIGRRPLPPKASIRVIEAGTTPHELWSHERLEWKHVFQAQGQDAAVNHIDRMRLPIYEKDERIATTLTLHDNELRKKAA